MADRSEQGEVQFAISDRVDRPEAKTMRAPKRPFLPLYVLAIIGKIEQQTRAILQNCLDENFFLSGFVLDLEKVTEILLASATESFRAKVEGYEAQEGFCRDWLDEIVGETIDATLHLAPSGFYLLPGSHRYNGAVPVIREKLTRELRAILKWRAEARKSKVIVSDEQNAVSGLAAGRRMSAREVRVHDAIGSVSFRTLTNAEIMKEAKVKTLFRTEKLKVGSDAAKLCLDRIRRAKGYPLSREIAKQRSALK